MGYFRNYYYVTKELGQKCFREFDSNEIKGFNSHIKVAFVIIVIQQIN